MTALSELRDCKKQRKKKNNYLSGFVPSIWNPLLFFFFFSFTFFKYFPSLPPFLMKLICPYLQVFCSLAHVICHLGIWHRIFAPSLALWAINHVRVIIMPLIGWNGDDCLKQKACRSLLKDKISSRICCGCILCFRLY